MWQVLDIAREIAREVAKEEKGVASVPDVRRENSPGHSHKAVRAPALGNPTSLNHL